MYLPSYKFDILSLYSVKLIVYVYKIRVRRFTKLFTYLPNNTDCINARSSIVQIFSLVVTAY